jgi:hypothetical protein
MSNLQQQRPNQSLGRRATVARVHRGELVVRIALRRLRSAGGAFPFSRTLHGTGDARRARHNATLENQKNGFCRVRSGKVDATGQSRCSTFTDHRWAITPSLKGNALAAALFFSSLPTPASAPC